MPRSNSPELKYNTLKPRRRKHRHSQFYSLRLCRKHEAAAAASSSSLSHRNFQVYAIPIYKTCPHKNGSTSTIATSIRSAECTPTSTLTRSSRETIKSEIIETKTIKHEMIEENSQKKKINSTKKMQRIEINNSQEINAERLNFDNTKVEMRINLKNRKSDEKVNMEKINLEQINLERINSELIEGKRISCGKKAMMKKEVVKSTTTTTTTPPIPAPRTRKTNPIEHTYQNIPPPVFPEKSNTACKLKVCRPLILLNAPFAFRHSQNIATAKCRFTYIYISTFRVLLTNALFRDAIFSLTKFFFFLSPSIIPIIL